jgi:NADP-dependent aldehyde dehydrogenase
MYPDISLTDLHQTMETAWEAFLSFRKTSPAQRAALLRSIAHKLEHSGDELIRMAMQETHLPEGRLKNERGRTCFQLTSYADACEQGIWLEARIDTALPERIPPRPDIRKMNTALGPVVVFGASNFPFAYSTAGGDTATALAAGCPVIVKAHPAHPETSAFVAQLISEAVAETNMPSGVFQHVFGASFEVGKALAMHPYTKAVGFTGSFSGGKQLYDWAQQRPEPIPVFSEMGSTNPVFILPEKLAAQSDWMAEQLAGSITLGVGQFCTNPGLIITTESEGLDAFLQALSTRIRAVQPSPMLHAGISQAYQLHREKGLSQPGVSLLATADQAPANGEGQPTIAVVGGATFLANPQLHKEVFGPYSLVIRCADQAQMNEVALSLDGQLTCSLMATEADLQAHTNLTDIVSIKCGRLNVNTVPTGVEVCWSMQHGGPFPATTDSRFGSVGPDAIRRFVRPISYQNVPQTFLPDELKDSNPLKIPRVENGRLA